MKRALLTAFAAAVVIASIVFVATRGVPSEAATPAAIEPSERDQAASLPTLTETPELFAAAAQDGLRSAVETKASGVSLDILGRVVDELDRPIEEFSIHAIHRDERNVFIEKLEWPNAKHARGEFDLRGLAPGWWDIVPFGDDLTRPAVRSFASSPTERVVFTMSGSALIDGVVLDPDGWPIENASVRVENWTTQTNDQGKFELRLSPGAYVVHAEAPGYALSDELEFRLATRDHIAEVRLGLERLATLRGVALDEQGAPLSGWRVELAGRRTPSVTSTTDDHGQFELAVGKPETLRVRATKDADAGSGRAVDLQSSRPPGARVEYATTLLASNVQSGRITLRIPSAHRVRLRATILLSDRGDADRDSRLGVYLSVEALDGHLVRDMGFRLLDELNFDIQLPAPGRYLVRRYDMGKLSSASEAELGSQIIDVPERDEFEVTLDL